MSVELYSASEPGPAGNNAALQSASVGGNKPLHRFIKGQPKILGIVALVLGTAFFLISIVMREDHMPIYVLQVIPSGFLQGALFIVCGIVYILTEHNPTKKTVTASLALSISTLLGSAWTLLEVLPNLGNYFYDLSHYERYNGSESHDQFFTSSHMAMEITVILIFVIYTLVGAVIFIVMSVLASLALRSTKSQTIVVMTAETATPAQ